MCSFPETLGAYWGLLGIAQVAARVSSVLSPLKWWASRKARIKYVPHKRGPYYRDTNVLVNLLVLIFEH